MGYSRPKQRSWSSVISENDISGARQALLLGFLPQHQYDLLIQACGISDICVDSNKVDGRIAYFREYTVYSKFQTDGPASFNKYPIHIVLEEIYQFGLISTKAYNLFSKAIQGKIKPLIKDCGDLHFKLLFTVEYSIPK